MSSSVLARIGVVVMKGGSLKQRWGRLPWKQLVLSPLFEGGRTFALQAGRPATSRSVLRLFSLVFNL